MADLGCEFELTAEQGGSGELSIAGGWVAYHRSDIEMLIPAGHASRFSATNVGTPIRTDASSEFREAVEALDALVGGAAGEREIQAAVDVLARVAQDDDYFTLLSLLTRHPSLASGAIYERLQESLIGGPIDEGHRARWLRGESAAINAWWQQLPRQPKTWWLNWRDAL